MGARAEISSIFLASHRVVTRRGIPTLAAAAGDLGVAGPTNVPLFNIAGGDIMVVALYGKVVPTALPATGIGAIGATTINLFLIEAVGGGVIPMCTVSAAINGQAINTIYSITGAPGVQMVTQTGAALGVGALMATNKQALVSGVIILQVAASWNTGTIDWTVVYQVLSPTSRIVAA